MNRDELTNLIAMPDTRCGSLAVILQILRRKPMSNTGKRRYVSDVQWTFHAYVGFDDGPFADFDVRSNDAVRTNLGGRSDPRRRIYDRGRWIGIYEASFRSASLHIIVASDTITPST